MSLADGTVRGAAAPRAPLDFRQRSAWIPNGGDLSESELETLRRQRFRTTAGESQRAVQSARTPAPSERCGRSAAYVRSRCPLAVGDLPAPYAKGDVVRELRGGLGAGIGSMTSNSAYGAYGTTVPPPPAASSSLSSAAGGNVKEKNEKKKITNRVSSAPAARWRISRDYQMGGGGGGGGSPFFNVNAAWGDDGVQEEEGASSGGGGVVPYLSTTSRAAFAHPGSPPPREILPARNASDVPLNTTNAKNTGRQMLVTTAAEAFTFRGGGGGGRRRRRGEDVREKLGLAANPRRYVSSATGAGVVL